MEFAFRHYSFLVVKLVIWGLLFFRGYRFGLIRLYPRVFFYIGLTAFTDCLAILFASIFGVSSALYRPVWLLGTIGPGLAAIWALLGIYSLRDGFNIRRDWHFGIALAIITVLTTQDKQAHWIEDYFITAVYSFVMYVSLVTAFRCLSIRLGRNLWGVILAILIPSGFETITVYAYMIGEWKVSTETYISVPIVLLSWLILLWGLWVRAEPVLSTEQVTNAQKQEAFKLIRRGWKLLFGAASRKGDK